MNLKRLGSKSSIRQSQSDELMPKIPLKMRQSFKEQKEKKKSTFNFMSMFNEFKNAIERQKDCSICLSPAHNGCSISDCQHLFCQQCLMNYLTYKINSMEEILCPEEGCNKKLDVSSPAFKSLPQNYKQKFHKQQMWHQTMKNPDLKLCPIETCKQGTINMRKIPPQCKKCKTIFCQQCMMIQHPNKQCDQNFKLNFKEWKRCPKCSMFIERTQGCNHMTCRCRHEFCFICLADWDPKHYSCISGLDQDLISPQETRFPKLTAIGMVLLIPIFVVLAILVLVVGSISCFVIGFYIAITFSIKIIDDCCCCGLTIIFIALIPLIAICTAIGSFFWGIFYQICPFIYQYAERYLRNIKNLCINNPQGTASS